MLDIFITYELVVIVFHPLGLTVGKSRITSLCIVVLVFCLIKKNYVSFPPSRTLGSNSSKVQFVAMLHVSVPSLSTMVTPH